MPARVPRVLVLMSGPPQLDMLTSMLPGDRFELLGFIDPEKALETLREIEIDVVVAEEELDEASGLDWLMDARNVDAKSSLVLLAGEDNRLELAVDAINRAAVTKLLVRPLRTEEVIEELTEAAQRYVVDTRRDRHLALSQVKVRRLTHNVQAAENAMRQNGISLAAAYSGRRAAAKRPQYDTDGGVDALLGAANEAPPTPTVDSQALGQFLAELVRAGAPDGDGIRIQRMADGCARALQWDASERKKLTLAASLHHALLPIYTGEKHAEVRGVPRHAAVLGEHLSKIPGFEEVAETVRWHHARFDDPPADVELTDATKILQVLSYFDELTNDPELVAISSGQLNDDLALVKATDQLLNWSGNVLDPDWCATLVLEVIPKLLGRIEYAVQVTELTEGEELSRTVYAGNLALVGASTELSEHTIAKIQAASEGGTFTHVWLTGMAPE